MHHIEVIENWRWFIFNSINIYNPKKGRHEIRNAFGSKK